MSDPFLDDPGIFDVPRGSDTGPGGIIGNIFSKGGMAIEELLPVVAKALPFLGGGGGGGSRSQSSSASNLTASINPVIFVSNGPAQPGTLTSGGNASGSPATASPTQNNFDFLPTGDGLYRNTLPRQGTYGDVTALGGVPRVASASAGGLDALISDPIVWIALAGAGVLIFASAKGK